MVGSAGDGYKEKIFSTLVLKNLDKRKPKAKEGE